MAETVRIEIPIETIDNTDPELSNVTKGFEKMEKAAKNANTAAKKAGSEVSKFDKQAEKTEKSLSRWAKEKYEILLEAKDRISPILSTIGNGLKGFAGKTWNITMRAIDFVTAPVRGIVNLLKNPIFQVGAVLGVSIGLKDTIETYKDFEAAMSQVQAVSGATSSELNKLTAKAKEMGATTKFTAEESAEAFNYMAMAGWKTEDMLNGIEGILSLAAASGEDLATTSDIVTDALTAFNMKAADAGHFSDVMAAAASNANTTVSGMGETFKYAGSMAGALGYSIEDVALMTGLMANTGIKATMAGTSLNSIFTRLSTNTNGAADAMSKLGIEFFDTHGNARDLSDVMGELRKATAGMNAEQKSNLANTIAGTQAQKGLLAILNASEEDYNNLAKAIENADGSAAKMSDTMLDNLQGSITLLQSAVDGVKISFGERLSPYVRGLADWLTAEMPEVEQGLDEFMDWFDSKADRMKKKFDEIADTKEWQDADFFGKAHIAWDEFIAEPFSEWWNGTGKTKFAGFAQDIGEGIGTGIKIGVMTLLGIDIGETIDEGASIGASFAKGFSEGFDFKAVSEKMWDGLGNLLSSAGKLLPGGQAADLSSIFSAVMLSKIAKPLVGIGKGATNVGKGLFGKKPQTGASLVGSFLGSTATGTGLLGKSAMLAINLGAGNLAGGASMSTAALGATGMAAGAGGIAAGATLVSSALDAYKAVKSEDADESKAYGESAAWKAGGVAAGAAAGAAIGSIIPGLGTAVGALVGAGVGGISGWIKGNKVKKEYQENVEEMQRKAEQAQKTFEATGFSLDKVTFETEALNKAIDDTEVSAEQLGLMFQEAVGDKLKSKFGNIHLGLKEIKDVASKIVFDKQTDNINKFAEASQASSNALGELQTQMHILDKLNWKMGLGLELSEVDQENYRTAVDEFVNSAKEYIEDKHYEATVSMELLIGKERTAELSGGLNGMYESIQSQIDELSGQLTAKIDIALEDGVITIDEEAEIVNLQQQISDITAKVTAAQQEAQFASLKIRFGGSELDAESFASLQEELANDVESMTQSYDNALEVSLTNLQLQLSEGAIDQSQYDEMLAEVTEGYNAKIDELQVRVESFQLDAISEAFSSELDGILPDLEGTTSEKLTEAMNNAMAINPEPATWTAEDIAGWFGLESLSAETQVAISELLQQTAETIPERIKENITSSMSAVDTSNLYAGIDFVGPFSNEFYEQMAKADLSGAYGPLMTNIGTTLPSQLSLIDYSGCGTSVTTGAGTAIGSADMGPINAGINTIYNNTGTQINSTFANPFTTSADVNVNLNWKLMNPTANINVAGGGKTSVTASIGGHASGGYVGNPELSWLAEEGWGEYVIPTNPSRRSRALDLYEQAGRALGVTAHADGGFVGGSILSDKARDYNLFTDANRNVPLTYNETTDGSYNEESTQGYEPVSATREVSGSTPVSVQVSVAPEFVIHSNEGQSEEDIMQVIRRHMKEMADELGGEIAGKLEEVFSNMPLKEA